jgi:hypothetical protein
MALYKIQGPDGKRYGFEAPAGLSDYDVNLLKDSFFAPPEAAPTPPPAPKPDTGFIPSVKRGYAGLESLLGDVLPAMAAKAVGADEYAKKQMREAAATQEEIAKKYPSEVPSYKDIKDVRTGFKYIVESVGEAIPSILPSLFTGGAAAIAGRGAVAAARAAAEDAVMKGAAAGIGEEALKKAALDAGVKAAQSTALKYEASGALAGSAAQNIPDVYQNIYEKTGKEDLGAALAFGGFNAVLDAITPLNLMRKIKLTGIPEEQIAAAWYKRAGKGALEGLATEGGTEALQEMSSAAAERLVAQHGDFFTKENFERFINAGLKGGLGGAGITSATNVAFGKGPEAAPVSERQALEEQIVQQPGVTAPPTAPTTQAAAPRATPSTFEILEQPETEAAVSTPATEALKADIEKQKEDFAKGVTSDGRPLTPKAKQAKAAKIAKLETKLTEVENAGQAVTEPVGGGVPVPSGADTNIPSTGEPGGVEAPGVVSAGENAPNVVAGKEQAPAPVEEPKPGIVNQLAREEQKKAGWNEDWPFIPADLGNADFRRSIAEDPSISPEDKVKIFEAGKKLGVVPKDEQITEPKPKKLSELTAEEVKQEFTEGEPSVTETPQAVETTQEGQEQAPAPEPVAEEPKVEEAPAPEPVVHTEDQIDDYNAAAEYHNEQKGNEKRQLPTYDKLTPEQKESFFASNPTNGEQYDAVATKLANEVHGKRKPKEAPLPKNIASLAAVIQNIRTASTNPVHKALAQLFFKMKLKTKLEFVNSLPKGRPAEYDPKTDTIYATKQGMDETVMLHELTHAATVNILYQVENGGEFTEQQEYAVTHIEYLMDESRDLLADKFPEAYKNIYEFMAHAITNEEFQRGLEEIPVSKKNSIFSRDTNAFTDFIRSIFQFLGLINDQSNFKAEAFKVLEDIISVPPAEGINLGTLTMETKQAEEVKAPKTDTEILNDALKEVEPMAAPKSTKAAVKGLFTRRGAAWMVERFQNDRYPLKQAEERAVLFNILERMGDKLNNVYGQITRSSGIAVDLFNQRMKFPIEDVNNAVDEYAKKKGIDINKALAELHLILEARHEPERRFIIYMQKVPLDQSKQIIKFNGTNYSAFGFRDEVERLLANPEAMKAANTNPAQLRGMMDKIITDVRDNENSRFRAKEVEVQKKRGEPEFVPVGKEEFNIANDKYNVIAGRTPAMIAAISRQLDVAQHKAEIDAVSKTLEKVHEQTKALNKEANYQSEPVSNIIDFYDFKNYVPFKGRPGATKAAQDIELDSQRLGGEMQEGQDRMEGRMSESENPILQSLADGATAAMRAGRKDLTLSIKNAVDKNRRVLQGRIVDTIKFDERFRGVVNKQSIVGQNKIFHYNADGTIDIIEITDKRQSEAIRRSYRESQPIMDAINNLTSGIGQTHTRYNPAFAPMNFVRDALTNAFTIGAELGPVRSGKLLSFVASEVASGGMGKSLRYSNLYAKGKFEEIAKLAESDPYYKDLNDYVQQGGRVSYLQGVAAKGALDQLVKDVGRSGIMKKKEQIDKFIDIYNDMFELSSRVATYRFLKEEIAKDNAAKGMDPVKAKADAEIQAVEYAKNLANFEQVGRWGKNAGALFMFFRPAATGAVRAIEALAPAFMPINEAEFREANKDMGKEKLDQAIATMKQRQRDARVMAATLTGVGVGMYLMAMMMAGDDDQGRNRVLTDDMSRWTRYARFFIPGTDTIIQIPWGFGLGSFGAAGAQIASMFAGRASVADGLSNILTVGFDAFLPIPISRISPVDNFPAWAMDSVTPSALRPFFEYVMNMDGLGREIYNNRQTKYGDAYTGGDSIPELYKYAARELFNATNGAVDWSPNTMYFFASNYVDGMAKALTGTVNLGLTVTGQKPVDLKNDTLFLSSFLGTKSNVDAREFSKVENQIKQMEKRVNAVKDKPDLLGPYLEEHAEDYYLVQYYNQQVNGTLRQLRANANQIRANREMTIGERKEKLEGIVNMENMVKRQLLNNFEYISGIKP